MTYDTSNRGTLGKNKRREKDSHPEYTGKCEIDGVGYWLNAWVKEANGEKFFSLSFKRKDEPAAAPARPAPRTPAGYDDSDGIPF